MTTINPYITFDGNCEEVFKFYKTVFGGKLMIMRYKDTPDLKKYPKAHENKIMHVSLPVGQNVLMGCDALPPTMPKIKKGNNFALSISAESKKEADAFFKKLSKDGSVQMPMADVFWGAYFGMLTDKFGVQWMVSYSVAQPA